MLTVIELCCHTNTLYTNKQKQKWWFHKIFEFFSWPLKQEYRKLLKSNCKSTVIRLIIINIFFPFLIRSKCTKPSYRRNLFLFWNGFLLFHIINLYFYFSLKKCSTPNNSTPVRDRVLGIIGRVEKTVHLYMVSGSSILLNNVYACVYDNQHNQQHRT